MKLGIIFDFDGVIVDSLKVWGDAYIVSCKHHGYGRLATQKIFLEFLEGNIFESMEQAGIDEKEISSIRKILAEDYLKNKNKVRLFDGVKEMLKNLAKKHKIFIVSSNLSEVAQHFLDSHELDMCEEVLGADKGRSKVKKIEAIKARYPDYEFLYVGDTKGDMIEGREADAKTVAVTWGWHSEAKLKEGNPDFVVHAPEELVLLVKKLREK